MPGKRAAASVGLVRAVRRSGNKVPAPKPVPAPPSLILPTDLPPNESLEFFLEDLRLWTGSVSDLRDDPSAPVRFQGQFQARFAAGLKLLLARSGASPQLQVHLIIRDAEGKELLRRAKPWHHWLAALDMARTPDDRIVDGHPATAVSSRSSVKTIAFYLPQFYPFRENDETWGTGFTEWTNVIGAKPQFDGQVQPLMPADLGFYDIRLKDVRDRQAALATEYGIDAFCYYLYWFSGRRVMREGLDEILKSGSPDKPFCLCWANETWSRRWDGSETEVIVKQEHDPEKDVKLIDDLIPFFMDRRYLCIDGQPILLIYRLSILHEATRVFDHWRKIAKAAGFPGLKVLAIASFGLTKTEAGIVDGVVEFPPHTALSAEVKGLSTSKDFTGKIYDYREVVENAAASPSQIHPITYPGIMPRWDNTARRGASSHIFANATPSAFKVWTTFALERAALLPEGQRLVFINSWNEWAEGAMLEPDRHFGRAFLEAFRQARGGYAAASLDVDRYRYTAAVPESDAVRFLKTMEAETRALARVSARLTRQKGRAFRPGDPDILKLHLPIKEGGRGHIEYCLGGAVRSGEVVLADGVSEIGGWSMMHPEVPHTSDSIAYLVLVGSSGERAHYHLPVFEWIERPDVAEHFRIAPASKFFGFRITVDFDTLPIGAYAAHLCRAYLDTVHVARLQVLQRL